jgi:hypothetical protein
MQQRRTHWGLLFAAAFGISNSLLRWRVHDGLRVRQGLRESEVATRRGVGSGVEPTICSGGRHRCWFRCRRHGPSRQAISSRSSCPGRWRESRTAGAWQDIDKFLASWAEHQRSGTGATPFSHQWLARWFRCCHPRPSRQCFVSSPGGSCSTNGRGAYSGAEQDVAISTRATFGFGMRPPISGMVARTMRSLRQHLVLLGKCLILVADAKVRGQIARAKCFRAVVALTESTREHHSCVPATGKTLHSPPTEPC